MTIYKLTHKHNSSDGNTEKMDIGVYSTRENALVAIESLKDKEGFRDTADGFEIKKTTSLFKPKLLDKTFRIDGFVTNTDDDSALFPEPEVVELHATVTKLQCEVKVWGTKTPKVIKEFSVSFVDDTGTTYDFKIPEEMYEGFEEGQIGTLTLSNGNLYGFELDE